MFTYDKNHLQSKLAACISGRVPADAWKWLNDKAVLIGSGHDKQQFMIAFAATTRKMGKQPLLLSEGEYRQIQTIRPGFVVQHWAMDRLCRVWLILHLDTTDREKYVQTIESLFPTAEMTELVALYSALPVLAYPEQWRARCAEGIRSNIADVLEAIMCNNPYPSEQLDEAAWNQLVLKAIFTEKPIHTVIGLMKRSNQKLANSLSDYANERWAAHRSVLPLLWQCVGPFINEKNFGDIQRLAFSTDTREREAAALACMQSNYAPAHELVRTNKTLQAVIDSRMTWLDLAQKVESNS